MLGKRPKFQFQFLKPHLHPSFGLTRQEKLFAGALAELPLAGSLLWLSSTLLSSQLTAVIAASERASECACLWSLFERDFYRRASVAGHRLRACCCFRRLRLLERLTALLRQRADCLNFVALPIRLTTRLAARKIR